MKILIGDDHPLFCAGIRHVLAQLGSQRDPVEIFEASSHDDVVEQATKHSDFSLVLLDLYMPGRNGLAALESLTRQFPALPIVVLSASENRADMVRAFDHGALGFVPKSSSVPVILGALRLVLAGGIYVPPAMIRGKPDGEVIDRTSGLTPRQADVLACVVEGKSNKCIAAELNLTEATVKAHITAVFKTLKVTNRMQAAIAAEQIGLNRSL
jgi:DNA-binding NarL/FixJ family response regulator